MNLLSPELLREIEERAVKDIVELFEEVVERALGADGMTYGEEQMTREERIANYQWLAAEGALDSLQVVNGALLERMTRQYQRDLADAGLLLDGGAE